ncbi:hypothetical protein Csa_000410 [Cucumis sativus]|nr:hypothetical protein Csa_000410 [Cucumis sativus]
MTHRLKSGKSVKSVSHGDINWKCCMYHDDTLYIWRAQEMINTSASKFTVALNPSRKDAANECPLKIALFSLAKMCAHTPCRQFLLSSKLFPVIGQLRQSPESIIAKYASVIVRKVAET